MPNHIRWRGDDASSIRTASSSDLYDDDYDRSSYDSSRSYSTAQTAYSVSRPPLQKNETCFGRVESHQDDDSLSWNESSLSIETYASTEASDAASADDEPAYEVLEFDDERCKSDAIPATPRDFADLFPSSRRLSIHHDDSTIDGNMNLRVDTLVETEWSSRKQNLTLFHLKMNDLKSRDFSLRRYCRDSGREVCKSIRKYQSPPKKSRPALTKSLSNALETLKWHHDDKSRQSLKRNDSSLDRDFDNDDDASIEERQVSHAVRPPTRSIKMEFSNYAHVELKRAGTGPRKAYQFEYWGHEYTWKRTVAQHGELEEVSFHLLRRDKTAPLALIVPVPLTRDQARDERSRGGWIPPCSMWISDADIVEGSPDLADLVVATGLLALVDDAIKRRWHSGRHRQALVPLLRSNSYRVNMEYIGAKRLIDGVFNRRQDARASFLQRC